jgi:proline iminopeptidase
MMLTLSEPAYAPRYTLEDVFFPVTPAIEEGFLPVSDLHRIWYGVYGNPKGIPVVFLHGGPGGGCSPQAMRYFNPAYYRVVLFDQRGAGKSLPTAEIRENTTQDLIADIEQLRRHLQIDKWLVFGGSWGTTLSLAYGQIHPTSCLGFILRGIFLGYIAEYEQLWYGMRDTFPELWDIFVSGLPADERADLIGNYTRRILSNDADVALAASRAFVSYDVGCSFLLRNPAEIAEDIGNGEFVRCLSTLFSHYGTKQFFLKDGELVANLPRITHLPAIIIHGRYDTVCRVKSAYELYQQWPGSELVIVQDAGHAGIELGTAKALVDATERMRTKIG